MNNIELLARQTEDAYKWTNKLILSIPAANWEEIPPVVETNVSWQVGHLVISFYFHTIAVIRGHQKEIMQKIPLKDYSELFTDASPENCKGKLNPEKLQNDLLYMEEQSLLTLKSLGDEELYESLEPTRISHPVATNKFEAIDWNIKHTMWHCGQIGILKRIIHGRYDFGLRREG